ncbi:MAG: efflux RND transporter permease subunit [Bacteroidales bacterium]|nr:efflux RND transporter permease subunit [Bacteroidales bacterium]
MKRLPSFSVILVFVVLTIVGAGMIPMLNIQYSPSQKGSAITISYGWSGASAKLVESEVTSKIEGIVSSVPGVKEVSSISKKEGGSVTAILKNKKEMEMVRFDISSMLRQIYSKLPDGVTYPIISGSASGVEMKAIITYTINADLPTQQIEYYTQEHIVKELALIDGVSSVNLSGATPFYNEVSFDPEKMHTYGISIGELTSAVRSAVSDSKIVGSHNQTGILLKNDTDISQLADVPVKTVNGHIIRVSDAASIKYKEKLPSNYYRINGLNTINVTVYPEQFVNTLELCDAVKEKMESMKSGFPDKFSAIISYDSSIELRKELNKVVERTILSVLILLVFVLITSRSWRYLLSIAFSLTANVLIAFIFYVMFDLEIHIFSLAGITVSLGIIIDTSIVMISHYSYYRNRNVFISILAAQLTTIGALAVIFLLPERQKADLSDFAAVIIVNLAISLLISMLLIPALWDELGRKESISFAKMRNARRVVKFNKWYEKYIILIKKYKWATFAVMVLAFGLPFNELPDKVGNEARSTYGAEGAKKQEENNLFEKVYNATLGTDYFKQNLKKPLDKIFGGSIGLFLKYTTGNMYRQVERPSLQISAALPDGCTIGQLNEIVLSMENYLTQFDQIKMFSTRITSYRNARITVEFKEDCERSFPYMLKQEVISKAIDFGGAAWSVTGVDDQNFNNNIASFGGGGERITVTGYNYDNLYRYCMESVNELSKNPRVENAQLADGSGYGWGSISSTSNEYFIEYDPYTLAANNLTLYDAYSALREQLYNQRVGSYYENGAVTAINVASNTHSSFDVWNLSNEYIKMGDDAPAIKFADLGHIEKRSSGIDIYKKNQQYAINISYSFIGTYKLSQRVMNNEIERLNDVVLPLGYSAKSESYSWRKDTGQSILLLGLVIAIIYFVCAILFESLTYPLIIIGLIPLSFVGVWLIFAATGCSFDQGGFASLVFLCGLVVNAGIYLLNEYKIQAVRRCRNIRETSDVFVRGASVSYVRAYVRAYNHKVVPIMLTVLSTLLGLIPFLFDGPDEVFWFAFAIGTIGGLAFSLIALIFFMPAWVRMKKR